MNKFLTPFDMTVEKALEVPAITQVADLLNMSVGQLIWNGADELYKAINNVRREYAELAALRYELETILSYESVCSGYGDAGKEELEEAHAMRREIQKKIWMTQATMPDKLLFGRAVKELKRIADPITLAVMKIRDRQYNVLAVAERAVPEGARTITPRGKIELKKYKLMSFELEETLKAFLPDANQAIFLANSNDFAGACEVIAALEARIESMLKSGEKIQLDANNAKVNVASQSLAAEIAGVDFNNKTTAQIIAINHNVKDLLKDSAGNSTKLARALGPDGEDRMDRLEESILQVINRNGFTLTLQTGKKLDYDSWACTAAQGKVGSLYAGEHNMMVATEEVRYIAMTWEEMCNTPDNGPEMLKRQAVLFTPSAPMYDAAGNPVTLNDVTMVKAIKTSKTFKNVLNIDDHGNWKKYAEKAIDRNFCDGAIWLLCTLLAGLNGQMRGYGIKGYAVDVHKMIVDIAKREGWEIPEFLPENWYLGGERRILKIRVLMTTDAWKWNKLGISWDEFVRRANELSKRYPTLNMLRIARLADATEESDRKMTRQANQQFITATDEQIEELTRKPIAKLNKFRTLSGMLGQFARLDAKDRAPYNELFERVPGILASKQFSSIITNKFHDKLAWYASGRIPVDGIYPYITEDPVAALKILIWNKDPNEIGLGYIKPGCVNIPNCEENREMFMIRYPANCYTGMLMRNHNDNIYETLGNTVVLAADCEFLIRGDGDTDGDEAAEVFAKIVISMMKTLMDSNIQRPLISFPHDKAEAKLLTSREARADEMAHAMFMSNKFGPAVGQYSMLATKWFNQAAVHYMEGNDIERQKCGMNAMWAYIGSVLAIDLCKTGKMPEWLKNKKRTGKLDVIAKYAPKNPWNQRFNAHSSVSPWWDEGIWDNLERPLTERESSSICDRAARSIVNGANGEHYTFDTEGLTFDPDILLSHRPNLYNGWVKGVLDKRLLAGLEARNFRKRTEDQKFLEDVRNGERVSIKAVALFLWRNKAALMRRLGKKKADKVEIADTLKDYLAFCREVLINFGDNTSMLRRTPDERRLSIYNMFIKDIFEIVCGNGLDEESKGSWADFIISVLAPDALEVVEENLEVPESERFAARHAAPEAELVF